MAKMFNYTVKYGGKFYPPNTPIVEAAKAAVKAETAQDKEKPTAKPETAVKAAKGRRKGDA